MMTIKDALTGPQANEAIANMAATFGITEAQAREALEATAAELSRGIERNTLSRGGLADFVQAIGDPRHSALRLNDPALFGDTDVRSDGNAILGHILGSKDASRGVAARVAGSTGLAESLIKLILPYVASLLMAALSRMLQGGLGDILGKLPGGSGERRPVPDRRSPREGPYGEDFGLPRQGDELGFPRRDMPQREAPPARETAERPQQRSPQLPADFPQQQPLPLPGSRNPYPSEGDNPFGDLTDIIRRGRGPSIEGGSLWSAVRNVVGGALGFTSKGVIGWLIRLIVVRFGWGILKRILGRTLVGR